MTDEILPLGYPPKTRRVCQPYIDQIAALSARLADAEAALATARADALQEAANAIKREFNISSFTVHGAEVFGCEAGSPARCYQAILALIAATPPALS